MIVSEHGNTLQLVRQADHAVLSGDIIRRWGNDHFERPTPFESVCLGIGKHDIGWVEPDAEVLFNEATGKPINFINANLRQHVQFYGNGYRQVLKEDPYAGLMIGMHWIGLYTSRFGYDPTFTYQTPDDLIPFMHENIVEQQKDWIEIKTKLWNIKQETRSQFEDRLWLNYELMQIMDRFSQILSLTAPDEESEATLLPVRSDLKGPSVQLHLRTPGDGTLIVDPFPFDMEFQVSVAVRKISNRRYESRNVLLGELNKAQEELIQWRIVPKSIHQ